MPIEAGFKCERHERAWTEAELQLLGTKPDAEVGRLIGRPGKAVWAKRRALGIADPPSLVRPWTEEEDKVVLAHSVGEAAKVLNRTDMAVRIRRRRLLRTRSPESTPQLLSLEEVERRKLEVPKYESKEQEEKVRLVGGPYAPPLIAIGGWLKCELRGELQVGGYSNALIPWPVAVASEVVRDALRLLEKMDKLEPADLETLIAEADSQPSTPMTAEDWHEVRRKVLGKERKAAA